MSRWWARHEAAVGDHGGIMPFVAICLSLLVVSAALAIDLGRFSVTARQSRNVADLAALDVVRILDGSTTADLQVPAEEAAARSAARNGFTADDGSITVVLGTYERSSRTFTPTSAAEVPDAVRIEVAGDNDNLFLPGSFTATRSATASGDALGVAGIGLATTTAAIDTDRAAVLNALLGDVLGSSVSLSVADWQALASSTVTLADLAVIGLGLEPTAVEELLDTTWSVGQLIDALATIPLPPEAGSALDGMVGLGPDPLQLRLGDIIEADLTAPGAHLFGLSIVDLLQASAMASGLGRTISVGLSADALGLASVTMSVQILEAPQFAIGGVGTTVRSAQVRALVDATLLNPLALPELDPALVHLPIAVDSGRGEATITGIDCAGAAVADSVGVSATTATASVRVAEATGPIGSGSFAPATLVTLQVPAVPPDGPVEVLRIDADATVAALSGSADLTFAPPYTWLPPQQVSSTGSSGDVVDVGTAQLTVTALGALPLPLPTVTDALLDTAVNPAMEAVVPPLLRALGVDLGVADVSIPFAACQSAALVQ